MYEKKPKTTPSPRKLLKVLVAAGMALGGLAAARAQEKPASDEKTMAPAEKGDKAKAKEKDAKAKAEKEKKKKKAEEKKAAEDEGGGVKGW